MEDVLINDEADNHCFGCSPHNDRGLQMTFVKRGAGEVESRVEVAAHFCGADGERLTIAEWRWRVDEPRVGVDR